MIGMKHLAKEFKMDQQKNLKNLFQRIVGRGQIVALQVSCDLRVILQIKNVIEHKMNISHFKNLTVLISCM
jgi:hypothetical protein